MCIRDSPKLVTEDMVKTMKEGSAIVDVAIDQGGCIETCDHITTCLLYTSFIDRSLKVE